MTIEEFLEWERHQEGRYEFNGFRPSRWPEGRSRGKTRSSCRKSAWSFPLTTFIAASNRRNRTRLPVEEPAALKIDPYPALSTSWHGLSGPPYAAPYWGGRQLGRSAGP